MARGAAVFWSPRGSGSVKYCPPERLYTLTIRCRVQKMETPTLSFVDQLIKNQELKIFDQLTNVFNCQTQICLDIFK